MKKFEAFHIGDQAEVVHTLTQADIDQYVRLTGDDNKIHVDKEYAGRTSFGRPVAHGMLGASFISTVIGTKLPGDGALWFAQTLEFLLPVRAGDTITVKAEILEKDERARMLTLKTEIFNQHGQKVTTGQAKVKVVEEQEVLVKEVVDQLRVALVVGATGGIGRAVCRQLSKDGLAVAVHYHKNKGLAEKLVAEILSAGGRAVCVGGDIKDVEQVRGMFDAVVRKFSTVTHVVNCATNSIPNVKFKDLEWKLVQDHFEMSVLGAFNILKCVVPIMEQAHFGKIIHITTQAIEKPVAEWAHYITAKSALNGFSKAMAFELAPKGIMLNMVSPGMTRTELIADIPQKAVLLTEAQAPLRRIADPEDIAGAVSFLSSDKANYLAGETIRVNGGQVML